LIEYAAVVLNTYHVNESTGTTAYRTIHGTDASERLGHFGERVFFLVPERRRSNLHLRWGSGVYLGTRVTSNEALIGLADGDVTRARYVARRVPNQRWSKDAILSVRGVPAKPRTKNPSDESVIESMHPPTLCWMPRSWPNLRASKFRRPTCRCASMKAAGFPACASPRQTWNVTSTRPGVRGVSKRRLETQALHQIIGSLAADASIN
jgi:hypothetical protein